MGPKKRFLELTLIAAAVTAVVLTLAYTDRPDVRTESATPLKFERTLARYERGRYLVEGLAHCFQCHSEVDWQTPGAQPKAGRKGAGTIFAEAGMEWLVAPNITPDVETGAGNWTDEQFARAIREGVGHDGRRLFPMMPYMNFRQMSDEDLASVIVYVRSIDPVRNVVPKTMIPEVLKGSLPPHQPITGPVAGPDMSNPVARGQYLVTLGNCLSCHTPMNKQGQPMMQLAFGGGMKFKGPWGEVTSANITPDPSGISYYDEALFVKTLRTGQVGARKLNSVMPWGYFRNLTDEDLKAIFAYLRTLKPVQHRIDNTEEPTECEVCGGRHGYGDRNHVSE
ncbi:MAG TPA: cytochrome c [Pyrinomonadaceae bacterium]|nr:cytochrome c [Pyrinomonadaceae bacterium]